MANFKAIDWDTLGLGEYEDPKEAQERLTALHSELLREKGIDLKPGHNSPGFNPTPHQAREVSVLTCMGLQPKDIALALNIELKLLKKYYTKELTVSHHLANVMVAKVALEMAMSGRNPDMTKFWLKSRAQWKETAAIELTGKDGGPMETVTAKDRLKQALAAQAAVTGTGTAPAKQTVDDVDGRTGA
jgi:hypothetical protein